MSASRPKAGRPAVGGELPLDADWERTVEITGASMCDLIAGLDSVGTFAVPYARLPRRLGTYAAEFPCWADYANQTPRALLARPKLGAAAVWALIEAGREAVRVRRETMAAGRVGAYAAVTRMVKQLDDFDRAVLSAQVWALDPRPQREVAKQLGVHQASVGRNLPRAQARFTELLADPAHHEVAEHADELRRRLGPYVPAETVRVELRRIGVDPSSPHTAEPLLYVAGPYARLGHWLENTAVPGGGGAQAAAAVDEVLAAEGAPTTSTLLHALTRLGMPEGVALSYLETLPLRRFGDVWVRWTDDTTGSRIEAVLHVLGSPATADGILDTIGPAGGSVDNINRVLTLEDRFVRATRRTWGLRTWGVHEYVSIAHAIGEWIDACGGEASVPELTAGLLAKYPDITESSIRTNLSTLGFVHKEGCVRRRTAADGWPPEPPLRTVRGAFHNGDTEIRLAMPVTSELLRGSGQAVHRSVAAAAGVTPGQQRTFTSPRGNVVLTWSLTSTHGANLGSLRVLAGAVDATVGDTLVLALDPDVGSLEVTRLGSGETGLARLRKLLGRPVRSPAAALSAALQCPRKDLGLVLRKRGDDELASMLDSS